MQEGLAALTRTVAVSFAFNADARNVRQARQALRGALLRSGAEELIDDAVLVLSEIVTCAFMYAGTEVRVHLWSTEAAVRVEVEDGAAHIPTSRQSQTAGTSQSLHLLDSLVDRWGVVARGFGKAVWFEIGEFDIDLDGGPPAAKR